MAYFQDQEVFISEDVENREVLVDELTKYGASVSSKRGGKACIHIVDSFKGKMFEELKKQNSLIVGVQCVFDSVNLKNSLPSSPNPIFSRTLEGSVFSTVGIANEDTKETLKNAIEYMNGVCKDEFSSDTTCLIATEVGSAALEYQVAVSKQIPVVLPSWVFACWKNKNVVPINLHRLAPFSGLSISVTGLSASTRGKVHHLVTSYGGSYSQDLTQSCSHLIAQVPVGNKYRSGMLWGVHVVTIQWLFDSINEQVCKNPSNYFLPLPNELPQVRMSAPNRVRRSSDKSSAPMKKLLIPFGLKASRKPMSSLGFGMKGLSGVAKAPVLKRNIRQLQLASSWLPPQHRSSHRKPKSARPSISTRRIMPAVPAGPADTVVLPTPAPLKSQDKSIVQDLQSIVEICDSILGVIRTSKEAGQNRGNQPRVVETPEPPLARSISRTFPESYKTQSEDEEMRPAESQESTSFLGDSDNSFQEMDSMELKSPEDTPGTPGETQEDPEETADEGSSQPFRPPGPL